MRVQLLLNIIFRRIFLDFYGLFKCYLPGVDYEPIIKCNPHDVGVELDFDKVNADNSPKTI